MKLNVNGKPVEVEVPADTPLLWVLREEVGLTGTKFGCGKALCGACTVHVDGAAKRSCVTAVGDVADKPIVTIEGLPEGDVLHPVQEAWIAEQTPLCGYCQNGMMIKATELLEKTATPSDAEIKAAFTTSGPSAHLCRCGSYTAILEAVRRASALMTREALGESRTAPI
jgi:isoquinoline 1-oxidoreductase alpha subunit